VLHTAFQPNFRESFLQESNLHEQVETMETNPQMSKPNGLTNPPGKNFLRSALALAVGVLTDLGGTNLVAAGYILWVVLQMASALAAQHLSQAEIQTRLIREFYASMVTSLPVLVIGLTFSVLGGLVAGRIARYAEVGFGAGAGVGTALVSIAVTLIFRLPIGQASFWKSFLNLAASLGASTLGGLLAYILRTRRRAADASLEKEIGANLKSSRRHSRYGMASLMFGILGFLGSCVSFISILFFAFQKNQAASQTNSSLAVIVFLGMLLPALIGAGLGVMGFFERERKKALAVTGFLLNAAVVSCIMMAIWLSRLKLP
jgi:hypothetical protein